MLNLNFILKQITKKSGASIDSSIVVYGETIKDFGGSKFQSGKNNGTIFEYMRDYLALSATEIEDYSKEFNLKTLLLNNSSEKNKKEDANKKKLLLKVFSDSLKDNVYAKKGGDYFSNRNISQQVAEDNNLLEIVNPTFFFENLKQSFSNHPMIKDLLKYYQVETLEALFDILNFSKEYFSEYNIIYQISSEQPKEPTLIVPKKVGFGPFINLNDINYELELFIKKADLTNDFSNSTGIKFPKISIVNENGKMYLLPRKIEIEKIDLTKNKLFLKNNSKAVSFYIKDKSNGKYVNFSKNNVKIGDKNLPFDQTMETSSIVVRNTSKNATQKNKYQTFGFASNMSYFDFSKPIDHIFVLEGYPDYFSFLSAVELLKKESPNKNIAVIGLTSAGQKIDFTLKHKINKAVKDNPTLQINTLQDNDKAGEEIFYHLFSTIFSDLKTFKDVKIFNLTKYLDSKIDFNDFNDLFTSAKRKIEVTLNSIVNNNIDTKNFLTSGDDFNPDLIIEGSLTDFSKKESSVIIKKDKPFFYEEALNALPNVFLETDIQPSIVNKVWKIKDLDDFYDFSKKVGFFWEKVYDRTAFGLKEAQSDLKNFLYEEVHCYFKVDSKETLDSIYHLGHSNYSSLILNKNNSQKEMRALSIDQKGLQIEEKIETDAIDIKNYLIEIWKQFIIKDKDYLKLSITDKEILSNRFKKELKFVINNKKYINYVNFMKETQKQLITSNSIYDVRGSANNFFIWRMMSLTSIDLLKFINDPSLIAERFTNGDPDLDLEMLKEHISRFKEKFGYSPAILRKKDGSKNLKRKREIVKNESILNRLKQIKDKAKTQDSEDTIVLKKRVQAKINTLKKDLDSKDNEESITALHPSKHFKAYGNFIGFTAPYLEDEKNLISLDLLSINYLKPVVDYLEENNYASLLDLKQEIRGQDIVSFKTLLVEEFPHLTDFAMEILEKIKKIDLPKIKTLSINYFDKKNNSKVFKKFLINNNNELIEPFTGKKVSIETYNSYPSFFSKEYSSNFNKKFINNTFNFNKLNINDFLDPVNKIKFENLTNIKVSEEDMRISLSLNRPMFKKAIYEVTASNGEKITFTYDEENKSFNSTCGRFYINNPESFKSEFLTKDFQKRIATYTYEADSNSLITSKGKKIKIITNNLLDFEQEEKRKVQINSYNPATMKYDTITDIDLELNRNLQIKKLLNRNYDAEVKMPAAMKVIEKSSGNIVPLKEDVFKNEKYGDSKGYKIKSTNNYLINKYLDKDYSSSQEPFDYLKQTNGVIMFQETLMLFFNEIFSFKYQNPELYKGKVHTIRKFISSANKLSKDKILETDNIISEIESIIHNISNNSKYLKIFNEQISLLRGGNTAYFFGAGHSYNISEIIEVIAFIKEKELNNKKIELHQSPSFKTPK